MASSKAPARRRLVIVESPTKARTIAGYLGPEFEVEASRGHIRDLPQPSELPADMKKGPFGKFAVDVDNGFEAYYVVDSDKKKMVAELKRALRDADELYLATDEDREGEAIAWHLLEVLQPKVPVRRMVFHEITREAIQRACRTRGTSTSAWSTRRRPGASWTASTATRSRRSCGARCGPACPPDASSPWLPGWWWSANGSGWPSGRRPTGTSPAPSPLATARDRTPAASSRHAS